MQMHPVHMKYVKEYEEFCLQRTGSEKLDLRHVNAWLKEKKAQLYYLPQHRARLELTVRRESIRAWRKFLQKGSEVKTAGSPERSTKRSSKKS